MARRTEGRGGKPAAASALEDKRIGGDRLATLPLRQEKSRSPWGAGGDLGFRGRASLSLGAVPVSAGPAGVCGRQKKVFGGSKRRFGVSPSPGAMIAEGTDTNADAAFRRAGCPSNTDQ